jgi:hypothetical protein
MQLQAKRNKERNRDLDEKTGELVAHNNTRFNAAY